MAWEMYLRMESTHESFIMLQILANDCYRAGHFFYSLKAFDVLERLDPAPECAQPPIFQYSNIPTSNFVSPKKLHSNVMQVLGGETRRSNWRVSESHCGKGKSRGTH
jgi:hypothetical protein